MTIDWSLRFSDIVSIGAFFFGGFAAILVVKQDMRTLALKFGFLEETVKNETANQNKKIDKQSEEIGKVGEAIHVLGRYDERMIRMQREIDELRGSRKSKGES